MKLSSILVSSIKLLLSIFVIALVAGCSISSGPPTAEVEKGVNWALSGMIDWNYRDKNLFESYKTTNHYSEKRNDGVAYVYDFEADCLVHTVFHVGQQGESKGWAQGLPKTDSRSDKYNDGELHHFKGTFTLIQKGNTWYPQETIR